MSERQDAGPSVSLSDADEVRLQLAGYLSSALSFIGTLYVLVHFAFVHWCNFWRFGLSTPHQGPSHFQHNRMDFTDKLVLVQALFDLVTIATRAVGRSVLHNYALCRAQAALIQAGNLASCSWICCMAYNLYRWLAGGESGATRQRRFPFFVVIAVVPGLGFVVYHLMTNKYGDATFYCWLNEIRFMFLNFYLFYLLMIVFNFVLLALIHLNMLKRVARHETLEADASSMLIRRKLLLYIVIFVGHRTPMMIYRMFEASGMDNLNAGLVMQVIQDLNGFSNSIVYGGICRRRWKEWPYPRDGSVSSSTESAVDKADLKRLAVAEDDQESASRSPSKVESGLSQSDTKHLPGSDTGDSATLQPFMAHEDQSYTHRTWQQRLQKRFLTHHSPVSAPIEPPKIAIFASTFNMGEKNVNECELREWIPVGQDIYVIGVQECMDINDLQVKISRHLVSGSTGKYVHYSREIGKRATALGYHGYIALCLFVRATAIASGRFQMPHHQRCTKNAQEVFRGKSLLLFGRASNKGAVGMSFRFDDTSFAFVTCHLASDSSRAKGRKRKKSAHAASKAGDNWATSSGRSNIARGSKYIPFVYEDRGMGAHLPPSKVERRNQDAMKILHQLYLDEEDYSFGFPHLHHHSFILGDFNYRMTRKGATPMAMLQLLTHAGKEHQEMVTDTIPMNLSSSSPLTWLQTSTNELSPYINQANFQQCLTPREQSHTQIEREDESRYYANDHAGTLAPNSSGTDTSTPLLLQSLVEEHDELYQLCRSQQVFHGFQESEITFYPTFRRIRGQALQEPFDAVSFQQNYSLVASHGGFRVPSYTDRVFYSSLVGVRDALCCLSYNSCEAVTSSDHKPVSACFVVKLMRACKKTSTAFLVAEDSLWHANSTNVDPMIVCTERTLPGARMIDVPGACELQLRIDFRALHWANAVDASHFDCAEHVEFGVLFPLPCEDVFARQRKLHEVADHLTFGKTDSGNSRGFKNASALTPTSNFHTVKWHDFVNNGLRYHTMADTVGRKHVAVVLRSIGRGRSMSKNSSTSRVSDHSFSPSSQTSVLSNASLTLHNNSVSYSSEKLYGHGAFCTEGMSRKSDVVVPLTIGGRLLGRLQLRISLQMRPKKWEKECRSL